MKQVCTRRAYGVCPEWLRLGGAECLNQHFECGLILSCTENS